MKKVILFCLLFSVTKVAQGQWERYQNLDFSQMVEDSLTGMVYWQSKDFVKISPDSLDKNACLKISGAYANDKPGFVYQQHSIEVPEYVQLRVSARIKGENITEGDGGAIYGYTKNGNQWLQYKNLQEGAIVGTEDWKRVSITIWVSPEATSLRIGASLSGKGSFWVDDFQIEVVEPEDCTLDSFSLSFMKECMDLIGQYSLYKEEIDTSKLMKNWLRLSACADSIKGVQEALSTILRSVDNHSFFQSAEKVKAWQNVSTDQKSEVLMCRGYRIDEHYAYIWMPQLSSGDEVTNALFADHLQKLIDSLDHKNLKGWVLDLRDNQGGNCWPMLAGIGPILGDGLCGSFKEGNEYQDWSYQSGGSYLSGNLITPVVSPYAPNLKNPPIAVLTGPKTSSSGEVVAVAFKNRPNTRSFGQATGGYTTGNLNHTLSDGSMLFLAQSIYTDRTKQVYPHGVSPDVEVLEDPDVEGDEVLQEGLEWLKEISN